MNLNNGTKLFISFITTFMMSCIFTAGASAADPDAEAVRAFLKQNYVTELSDTQLQGNSVKEIIKNVDDPYTTLFSAKDFTDFANSIDGNYQGIGIVIEEKEGYIEIVSVFDGSPAQTAGLQSRDMILAVDDLDIARMPQNRVVKLLRGEPGTKVNLTVERENQILQFIVTRAKISIPVVSSEMLADHILYINISSFANNAADLVQQELGKHPDTAGIIFDLRNNGGGYMQAAVDVGQEFLDSGPMVWLQNREGRHAINLYGAGEYRQPMVLLVNQGTASASELIAGAFQEEHRAVLVGSTTFGKFCVQSIVNLNDKYVLKFTTDYFLTPSQHLLNKIGVTPDIIADDQKAMAVAERSVADQQLMNGNYRYLLTVDVEDLTAYINGKKQFDSKSLVRNDHLYLKLRDVASELSLSVWRDENTQQVMVQKDVQLAELVIDNSRAFIEDGQTYVSMRELARIIGGSVDYQSLSNIAWLQWN